MRSDKIRKALGISKERWKVISLRTGIIVAATVVLFGIVYIQDNSRELEKNASGQEILKRDEKVTAKTSEELQVEIGDIKKKIRVDVSGQAYSKEELPEIFQRESEKLEELILGDNKNFDEVMYSMNLVTEIPDSGIHVAWSVDRTDLMMTTGEIMQDKVEEPMNPVKLTAQLSYGEEQAFYEFYINIVPYVPEREEQVLGSLEKEIQMADEETKADEYLLLPASVNGEKVKWSYAVNTRAFSILVLGIGSAGLIYLSEGQRKKEKQQKDMRQMRLDYPQLINKLNLYIGAGMTIRTAWTRVVDDYCQDKHIIGERKAYEEMIYTLNQMKTGKPESECYEEYGDRCRIVSYRKLGILLSQNAKKGTRGLTELLAREAEDAVEERKNLAKKLGEEAGTKLMIPMFMMLSIVFAIVIVPAFFSMQI